MLHLSNLIHNKHHAVANDNTAWAVCNDEKLLVLRQAFFGLGYLPIFLCHLNQKQMYWDRAGRELPVISCARCGKAWWRIKESLLSLSHITKASLYICICERLYLMPQSSMTEVQCGLGLFFFSLKCCGFNTIPLPHTFPFFVLSLCNRNSLKNLDLPLVLAGVWLLSARVLFLMQCMDENFTALRHNFNWSIWKACYCVSSNYIAIKEKTLKEIKYK